MNFDLYSYKYNCPRWYANIEGISNIYVKKDTKKDIKKIAIKKANELSGSKSCNISLLNKFEVSIKSIETYPPLTGIDLKKEFPKHLDNLD